jgi:hypothetical protein
MAHQYLLLQHLEIIQEIYYQNVKSVKDLNVRKMQTI